MIEFPYKKQAYNREPIPDGLDMADRTYYTFLVLLYTLHKRGFITKAEAVENEDKFNKEYVTMKSEIDFYKRESAKLKIGLAETSKSYAENRTLENADKMFKCFWNTKKVEWEE